jgi:hypothetical protein
LLISVIPAFQLMIRLHSAPVVYGATGMMAVLQAFLTAPALVTITESLPKAARSGVLATLYAVSLALFGGTTQFAIKWLTDATGSALAPAWYMTGALVVGATAMIIVAETAPAKAKA